MLGATPVGLEEEDDDEEAAGVGAIVCARQIGLKTQVPLTKLQMQLLPVQDDAQGTRILPQSQSSLNPLEDWKLGLTEPTGGVSDGASFFRTYAVPGSAGFFGEHQTVRPAIESMQIPLLHSGYLKPSCEHFGRKASFLTVESLGFSDGGTVDGIVEDGTTVVGPVVPVGGRLAGVTIGVVVVVVGDGVVVDLVGRGGSVVVAAADVALV